MCAEEEASVHSLCSALGGVTRAQGAYGGDWLVTVIPADNCRFVGQGLTQRAFGVGRNTV